MAKKSIPDFLKIRDGFIDITLASPANTSAGKIDVLTMREPTVRDQRAAQANGAEADQTEVSLMSNLCMLTPDDIDGLTLRNMLRVQTAFSFFLA